MTEETSLVGGVRRTVQGWMLKENALKCVFCVLDPDRSESSSQDCLGLKPVKELCVPCGVLT